jgi:5-methyltetrahydrofolate--homocysteine methyltransferase
LKDGGVDGVTVETFFALEEVELPIKAAKDHGLFCMATMTFDHSPSGFRSTSGVSTEQAVKALDDFGADVVGTNCGHGIEDMTRIVREMRPHTRKPILIRSNAGLPTQVDGAAVYGESPDWMSSRIKGLVEAGANIIGGCCGTTPEHIRRFRAELDQLK